MSVEESSIEENAQVEVASRLGFHLSMVLTEYERNILRDLLAEAAAQSLNHSAKIALEKMLDGVQSATQTTIPKATPEIGAIESAGEHKGEIYGGFYPADNKPIWFLTAPKLMDHYKAAAWAQGQGGSLPTRKQGDYLTTLKGKGGAFTEIFNRGNSFPAGYVWLAEPSTNVRNYAWCQMLSDGDQTSFYRYNELPVLCVVR